MGNFVSANLKKQLVNIIRSFFGNDNKRISHALKVTDYSEMILESETLADKNIVIASALLHDIGILEAEKKYNSNSGKYQEIEGPPIARDILQKLNLDSSFINTVCEIVGNHHTPLGVNSIEFKIICDADLLVNINDECDIKDKEKLKGLIGKSFNTKKGKEIAYKLYLN